MSLSEKEIAPAVAAAKGASETADSFDFYKYCTSTLLKVKPESIPSELQKLPFAVWKAEPECDAQGDPKFKPNGNPKIKKAPKNTAGFNISKSKPEAWASFDDCVAAYNRGGFSGIGLLLQAGSGIVGIDLDDVSALLDREPEVKLLLARAKRDGVYCEKSPSGTGLRLFVKGKLPGNGRRKGGIELYADSAFLTVTGQTAWSGEVKPDQGLIDGLLRIVGSESVAAPPSQNTAMESAVDSLCIWATEKEASLWAGRWNEPAGDLGGTEYPSQSEADMALIGALCREAVRRGIEDTALHGTVLEVFNRSGLYRPEKTRQIDGYAIPKALASALSSVQAFQANPMGAAISSAEPGDILAGKVFAREMRGKLLYVSQMGNWLRWDGLRWIWCSRGEEMQAAKHVAEAFLKASAALYASDTERHKKRLAFATRLQNLPRLQAMIELATSEPGMAVGHMTELDSNPWLLGVQNGIVDLKTGGLLSPAPDMLITRQAGASYSSDAKCPKWLQFLDSIFEGDQDTIGYIQRALGYSLTGSTTEETLFICYGHGANGKSVFGNVVSHLLGGYSQMAPPSLLTLRDSGDAGPRNDIARLCGARLVQINELSQGDRLDEQVVKMLAGREMLSARFLHKEFFDFWPTAKPWLRTNHRPVVTGEDDGIWRRLALIPFRRKFAESERDPWLESKLLDERDGILAWMIEGCLAWQKDGLRPSAMVRRESASYRTESDLLGEFLEDATQRSPENRVEQSTLYMRWQHWCDRNGVRAGAKASFSRKLKERGFSEGRSNGKRFYLGLALQEPTAGSG